MENKLAKPDALSTEILHNLVIQGDISKMNEAQRIEYYTRFCQSLGLNPLTQPFKIIKFQGKETLYATKDCTEQLRKLHGVSITDITAQELKGVYVVTAKAMDKSGKTDASTGVVTVTNLSGDALANALMKAETKAKRRVTLSICGLGILDESEMDTMTGASTAPVNQTNVDINPGPVNHYLYPELQEAIDHLQKCNTVDELALLKDSLDNKILNDNRFINAGLKRYKEVTSKSAA